MVTQRNAYAKSDGNAEVMDTPYDRWASAQGIDVFKGYFVENLFTIPLKWWERFGGYGILINLEGTGYMDDAFVLSIPPGAKSKPQRHVFEDLTYVLSGKGATTLLWPEGKKKMRVDWGPGAMLVPPEGWFHQHFNPGVRPARYLALKVLSCKYKLQPGAIKGDVPLDKGGWQIEYENEDPDIRRVFAAECARTGAIMRTADFART